jgi:O-succinylbenzoate synthase
VLDVYSIPLSTRFRGITVREGALIEGPAGWGEFCPFADYDDRESVPWLAAARGPRRRAGRSRCGTGCR